MLRVGRTGRLILVSNRLPVTAQVSRGALTIVPSAGGLATGLRRAQEHTGGSWVGWPGNVARMSDAQRRQLEGAMRAHRCVPVYLSNDEVAQYYEGFSNAVLWPLFHYMLDRVPQTSPAWSAYRDVNEKFADAVARVWRPGDIVWVHDYQLALVPKMLRARIPSASIGYFLHIPFPASEIVQTLSRCHEVLEGMLGANLIGFQTVAYERHFATTVLQILGATTRDGCVDAGGRTVRLGVFPIGVDAHTFCPLADDPAVLQEAEAIRREAKGESILVGIDRLDYTKGIRQRLLAFERLLEREPQWRGRVRLVQVAVPSRDRVPSYSLFQEQLNELVGRINSAHSTDDWVPIHYVRHSLNERQVAALYRAADVMLVTPVRDGMNLVAKEFVACRTDDDGVLVLSEFAGAAAEMGEALQVNPYDVEGMARAYASALKMPPEARRVRMRSMRRRIVANDVDQWTTRFVDELALVARESGSRTSDTPAPGLASQSGVIGGRLKSFAP
jgi:trehalose 6-phosphate synthase/phosphatase